MNSDATICPPSHPKHTISVFLLMGGFLLLPLYLGSFLFGIHDIIKIWTENTTGLTISHISLLFLNPVDSIIFFTRFILLLRYNSFHKSATVCLIILQILRLIITFRMSEGSNSVIASRLYVLGINGFIIGGQIMELALIFCRLYLNTLSNNESDLESNEATSECAVKRFRSLIRPSKVFDSLRNNSRCSF